MNLTPTGVSSRSILQASSQRTGQSDWAGEGTGHSNQQPSESSPRNAPEPLVCRAGSALGGKSPLASSGGRQAASQSSWGPRDGALGVHRWAGNREQPPGHRSTRPKGRNHGGRGSDLGQNRRV